MSSNLIDEHAHADRNHSTNGRTTADQVDDPHKMANTKPLPFLDQPFLRYSKRLKKPPPTDTNHPGVDAAADQRAGHAAADDDYDDEVDDLDADDERIYHEGWVIKKGNRLKQPLVRYFQLRRRHIYSYHTKPSGGAGAGGRAAPKPKKIDVFECTLRLRGERAAELELHVKYPRPKNYVLIAPSRGQARQWVYRIRANSVRKRHIESFYVLLEHEVLGDGINGKVLLGQDKVTGENIAIKMLPENELSREEVRIAANLCHEHVVRTVDVFYDAARRVFYMVMELVGFGELRQYITGGEDDADGQTEGVEIIEDVDVIQRIVAYLLRAVAYLHAHGVVHRDIKLENILCCDRADLSNIKLIDFGSSTYYWGGDSGSADTGDDTELSDHKPKMTSQVGTNYYLSPEMIQNRPFDESCDLWAVGVVVYILFSKQLPFLGETIEDYHDSVVNSDVEFPNDLWAGVDPAAIDLIRQLLQRDVRKRLSAQQALQHQWLAGVPSSERKPQQQSRQLRGTDDVVGSDGDSEGQTVRSLWRRVSIERLMASKINR